jgi:transcriptional regulator with XRE-family HTH domain
MPTVAERSYGRYTKEALRLLGRQIALGRRERGLTARELAERTGIARSTLHRIERGDAKVEIGIVFEAAAIAGVKLFDEDLQGLGAERGRVDDRLALLPRHVYPRRSEADDDF